MLPINETIAETASRVPMERIHWALMDDCGLELWIRRDDLLPQWCQGNKYYKLYHNLKSVQAGQVLVSFGGAFSNHLYALALAAKKFDLACIAIVRGERPAKLSPTLIDVEAAGVRLLFVSRRDYRQLTTLLDQRALSDAVVALTGVAATTLRIIPEGGANGLGVAGCADLGRDIVGRSMALFDHSQPFDDVLLAVGTGTTLAGLALGLPEQWQVSGVPVIGVQVKDEQTDLAQVIANQIGNTAAAKWRLLASGHLGGYGRTSPALLVFMDEFFEQTGILLDQVYTGKLFWAIAQRAQQGYWPQGARLLALHTGGLQGRRGLAWN